MDLNALRIDHKQYDDVEYMNVQEAYEYYKLLEIGNSILFIDVREPGELLGGYIPHALHLPMSSIEQDHIRVLPSLNNHTVILYCLSGYRSLLAAQMFKQQGFEKVYNLEGGWRAWIRAGLPQTKKS